MICHVVFKVHYFNVWGDKVHILTAVVTAGTFGPQALGQGVL